MAEKIKTFKINIGDASYPYYLVSDLKQCAELLLRMDTDHFYVLYDDKLSKVRMNHLFQYLNVNQNCSMFPLLIEESSKVLSMAETVIDLLFSNNITNHSALIAVGGGVLENIVGLVASLVYRGIQLVHIPTTVIAAADSTLSLKQAINHTDRKNCIGTFYKPECVIAEHSLFQTLPVREYKSGLVETVKNILCIEPYFMNEFLQRTGEGLHYTEEELAFIIESSVSAKSRVLLQDMRERQEGLVLEYGHTIGHAVELLSAGEVNHGEGVAFGMLVMAEISRDMGFLSTVEVDQHYNLLHHIAIFGELTRILQFDAMDILKLVKGDNKRGYLPEIANANPMVVLKKIGVCHTEARRNLCYVADDFIIKNINKVMSYIQKQF